MSQPIICYYDSSNGFNPINQSWGWLSFGGCTSYHNRVGKYVRFQMWTSHLFTEPKQQLSFQSDFTLLLLLASQGAAQAGNQASRSKCGSRCPLPDRDAQVGTLWMIGLGLNHAKVFPDNALGRVLNRSWMELEAKKPHTNLIPLWLWDLKNAATGSRNQL